MIPFTEKIGRFIGETIDTIRDVAVIASVPIVTEKIDELKTQSKRLFLKNVCFDLTSIVLLAIIILMNAPRCVNVIAIILVNCEIWGIRIMRLYIFNRDVYSRYKEIIKCAVKGAFKSLKTKLNAELAVKNAIREVCYHFCKIPMLLSVTPDVWLRDTTEQFIKALYKPTMEYIRYTILYNFLLFVICYGGVIFLVRQILIRELIWK